jgi:hypothetical protein
MKPMAIPKLDPTGVMQPGGALQNNASVRRIYTSVQPNSDGSWDLVTVVETTLVLDPGDRRYRAELCDRLIEDAEADLRAGYLAGRVTFRSA